MNYLGWPVDGIQCRFMSGIDETVCASANPQSESAGNQVDLAYEPASPDVENGSVAAT